MCGQTPGEVSLMSWVPLPKYPVEIREICGISFSEGNRAMQHEVLVWGKKSDPKTLEYITSRRTHD